MSRRIGATQANAMLERLLALSDGDLRNALGAAKEYADHPSVAGHSSMAPGNRLMIQIELGLKEVTNATHQER